MARSLDFIPSVIRNHCGGATGGGGMNGFTFYKAHLGCCAGNEQEGGGNKPN